MNKQPASIPKNPELTPAEDYYRLRREGIGFIAKMGGAVWTDFNTHDPGITILESLCYALTDLAYRTRWPITDLLMPETPSATAGQPYPNQAFFTARDILTVNPVTPDDFRRLLIDLEPVRNAWVFCKTCVCESSYFAWCENGQLRLSYQAPQANLNPIKSFPQGLYDILLELETDSEFGDLNDRKITRTFNVFDPVEGSAHPVLLELRFPDWGPVYPVLWQTFLATATTLSSVEVKRFGATKTYNVLTDINLDEAERNQYLRDHWRTVFYLDIAVGMMPGGQTVLLENVALRISGDTLAKGQTSLAGLLARFNEQTSAGFIPAYRSKMQTARKAILAAKEALQQHRNLAEDFCRVKLVDIEDVTVCTDIEVAPDADIDRVQAEVWFAIENYLNPPVPFHSLAELLAAETPVEAIFNGPELSNGFINAAELSAAGLKRVIRSSDIINSLMDIPGINAVNNLLLSKYDAEGNIVNGAADPTATDGGAPPFASGKSSAAWLLFISPLHQPRLHRQLSRFLFFKNGLPFLPRKDEANDTLIELRGQAERPKIKNQDNDLPIPKGIFRDPEAYVPLQYGFPLAYGIGPEGLPSHATAERRGQARQLKAYLMVFEQLLANAQAQIAHTGDLFSLATTIDRTYFFSKFNGQQLSGYNTVVGAGLTELVLKALVESEPEFYERRNRFLDHLMARFGEQFSEYALLLTHLQGRQKALSRLLDDKIAFLKAYPAISHDRGKAFDYSQPACVQENFPGIKKRVSLLLGYPDLVIVWTVTGPNGGLFTVAYKLNDTREQPWLNGSFTVSASNAKAAERLAFSLLAKHLSRPDAYGPLAEGGKFRVKLKDATDKPLGKSKLFDSKAEAETLKSELLVWGANQRAIVVEHLLLRPKFPGDALYPACSDGGCQTACGGDADPYSFRLTWVMPGWTEPYNNDLELRRFADRTIREQTPAHLLAKICWVGNDGFVETEKSPAVCVLADLLVANGTTAAGGQPSEADACACSASIYAAFSAVFKVWYQDKILVNFQADILTTALTAEFTAKVKPTDFACTTVLTAALWNEIQAFMVKHFHAIATDGWQFERFEEAWCRWLEANAKKDWQEERLQEHVQAMLKANLVDGPQTSLCQCAETILYGYGIKFHQWMADNITVGRQLNVFTPFVPITVTLREQGSAAMPTFCPNLSFKAGTGAALQTFLNGRYAGYQEVSYRLNQLVKLLGELSNTYPDATLHDCDDGSDQNPVRLGQTALGSLPAAGSSSATI